MVCLADAFVYLWYLVENSYLVLFHQKEIVFVFNDINKKTKNSSPPFQNKNEKSLLW